MSFLGRFISEQQAEPEPVAPQAAGAYRCAARSHVGKVRSLNEDRFVALPDARLWAIADGMGGHRAGDVAAELVAGALRACAAGGTVTADAAAAAVQQVNAQLVGISEAKGGSDISGSTVVALIVTDDHYHCLWAGDSRAYLYRDSRCYRISRDHSVVQELIDAGVIAAADAPSHPSAHVITRAVGAAATLRLDISSGTIEAGDLLLLCTDGLSDMVGVGQIEACLAGDDIEAMADALLAAALEAGAPDNISFIIIRAP
ncbi:PP2C family protein-serine/threonine phosphatase [Sphingosinicella rhizophila]|uniref:Protein phosphatase 2C domain-containing protein n=1 Tax=Sphingosinicella rhizophila TaxID=3050082 RepID=A0ABU3Q6C9_9SPHN|nr:protein phosphatase 2C domain-containing protein [Sphingosinicella sp. GR2756]MDT9598862.1 protein phosphatase 2C domain-containing protein [Sphingosinicella sp. GR2756]